jgi:hypothetical protein
LERMPGKKNNFNTEEPEKKKPRRKSPAEAPG